MKGKKGRKSGGGRGRVRADLSVRIGKAARAARLRLGLTQEDIAERVGIATEVYGRLERGKMLPSAPTLKRICTALGTSADFLAGITEVEATPAQPAPGEELTPEIRRLMRVVRTMDPVQLAIFKGTAAGLLRLNKQQQGKRGRSQGAIT